MANVTIRCACGKMRGGLFIRMNVKPPQREEMRLERQRQLTASCDECQLLALRAKHSGKGSPKNPPEVMEDMSRNPEPIPEQDPAKTEEVVTDDESGATSVPEISSEGNEKKE